MNLNETIKETIGTCLIDKHVLRKMERLWEGPLHPLDIDTIELGIRAFIVSRNLAQSRLVSAWSHSDSYTTEAGILTSEHEEPFGDQLLDYEFIDPLIPQKKISLQNDDKTFLIDYVRAEIDKLIKENLPGWITKEGEGLAFLDSLYLGKSIEECSLAAKDMLNWEEATDRINKEDFCKHGSHALFHHGPVHHAIYLVECHRQGMHIYSNLPIAKICHEHIFSKYPDRLFQLFDEEFRNTARLFRGPGIAIELPPLTTMVLSRAKNRATIPEVIRNMRDEYSKSRCDLWDILFNLWLAETIKEQIEILRVLEKASTSLFFATFPEKYDTLSLALGAARLSPSGIISVAEKLREHDKPNANISAISFTEKLSKDYRKSLKNFRKILVRHLTKDELKQFGMA